MSTIQTSSDTTANSPTPISPFSTFSSDSEETSDGESLLQCSWSKRDLTKLLKESPDLGAFTTVFRALNNLQPLVTRATVYIHTEPDTPNSADAGPRSSLPTDSEFIEGSTVWNRSLLASYLASSSSSRARSTLTVMNGRSLGNSVDASGEETEGEVPQQPHAFAALHPHYSDADLSHGLSLSDGDIDIDLDEHPSLGDLGGAFSFLAAERARLAARDRGAGKDSSTSDGAWRDDGEPRRTRRRRRKRANVMHILQRKLENMEQENTSQMSTVLGISGASNVVASVRPNTELEAETEEWSLVADNGLATVHSTPQRVRRAGHDRLRHSRSTPSLHLSRIRGHPQVLKLRCLAHKLRLKFAEDHERITALLTQDFSGGDSDFSDPRGPAPQDRDSLIHVFIDHSNILIGCLTFARRHMCHPGRKRRLSHAALALLLERGRPITRRCLVTSSPLYQPMDTAEQLGYEVRVLERVPDSREGQGRRASSSGNVNSETWRKGQQVQGSSDSERGGGLGGSGSVRNGRVRYREQGVDEVLQLKLHQAIADADVPQAGATIVLATGDGNVGQFSDEGFLGPVRTALKKGWQVELYAWEESLSCAWKREFGEETPWKDQFRIIKMEDFGEDLIE